jgi:uncharacterized circularly permuted ATP-grasp superfamily protein
VADDKAVYAYAADDQILFREEIALPNVPTYLCSEETQQYVLSHIDRLVIKPANESEAMDSAWPRASGAAENYKNFA